MSRCVLRLSLLAFVPFALHAQVNSWINPTSAKWETDANWSLGVRPTNGQSIFITNAGFKAVAIDLTTTQSFSNSIHPSSITIGANAISFNLLLLNFAGTNAVTTPQLIVGTNGAVTALSSSLAVNDAMIGGFSIGGAFNQGSSALVSAARLNIGDIGPGSYYLTNGTLLVTVTQAVGGAFSGLFSQFGGSNFAGNLALTSNGEYDIANGTLDTSNLIYRGGGTFRQQGGSVRADTMYVNFGDYILSSGSFSTSDAEVPGALSTFDVAAGASFIQTGGSNHSTLLAVGNWRPMEINATSSGDYDLSNGIVVSGTTLIGPYGTFTQTGGAHSADSVNMIGDVVFQFRSAAGHYVLSGGSVSSGGLGMRVATFDQLAGTNQISGNLTFLSMPMFGAQTVYNLSGGSLLVSNMLIAASFQGGFFQAGGTHVVSNLFAVTSGSENFSGYVLSGGELVTRDIELDSGAIFQHLGGTIVNTGRVTLAGGAWFANTNDQSFGALLLGTGTTNSTLSLPAGASVLRFAQSSGLVWSNEALLRIEHWNGAVMGSGKHQVRFGTSASGLSAQQLSKIQFRNPNGTSGLYPAAILPSGEIVPSRYIAGRLNSGAGLKISWPPGMTLQSATNVLGPYADVPGATSPFMPPLTQPIEFFRLRSSE